MVISGEGSDEIFGGYLYFHKAPNKEEFHRETCRKVLSFFKINFHLVQLTVPGVGKERDNREFFFCWMQIKALHMYDCLRANKSTSAWGLEARVPFLDKEFINVAMSIDPEFKLVRNKSEKNWEYFTA